MNFVAAQLLSPVNPRPRADIGAVRLDRHNFGVEREDNGVAGSLFLTFVFNQLNARPVGGTKFLYSMLISHRTNGKERHRRPLVKKWLDSFFARD